MFYITVLTSLEAYLIRNIVGFLIFVGLTSFCILAVRVYQNRFYYPWTNIIYEEEPDAVFIQLRG